MSWFDGKNFFDQPVKNNKITYENIRKIATGGGKDYITRYLLDYAYFGDNYKMIAIDLIKQETVNADPRAIHQIDSTANLDLTGNTIIFFILQTAKENVLDYFQGTVKVL